MNQNYRQYIELAIILGVIFLLYQIVKKFTNFLKDPIGTQAATEALQDTIEVDPNKLQYPRYQYKTWAEALKIALFGDIDEDEGPIEHILYQINSDNDMSQLISDFGVVNSTPFGLPLGHNYDLVSAINSLTPELTEGFNSHYAAFQMKFRF